MNTYRLINISTTLLIMTGILLLGGCGSSSSSPPATVVTGIASKGPIKNGTVKIYGVSDAGVKSATPLATVQTDVNGRFSANLGSYSGALITEASGDYADEATGTTASISAASPLLAAVVQVDNGTGNNRKIAVTPLTHLAYGLMGTSYTSAAITDANNRVGDLFKVTDIVGTLPVQPDKAGMDGGDANQKTYTMALATLSQMAKDNAGGAGGATYGQIQTIIDSLKIDLDASSTGGLSGVNTSAFNVALLTVSSTRLPGFDSAAANLASAGTTTYKLTVSAAGVPTGTVLGALEGIITVPAGVSIRSLASGETLPGLISATGTAATGSPSTLGNFNSTTRKLSFNIANGTTSFGSGACAVIIFDVTSGTNVTAADFAFTSVKGKDYSTGATVPEVTISFN